MNYIEMIILGLIAIFVGLGFLLGFGRGRRRATLRLILIVASIIFAWIIKGTLVSKLVGLEIFSGEDGKINLLEYISQNLPEEMQSVSYLIEYIVQMLLTAVSFVIIFIILKILTLIVYAILKHIFIKKGSRLIGAVIGALSGACIAFAICVPLNGLISEVVEISKIEYDGEKLIDLDSMGENVSLTNYTESSVSKLLSKLGNGFFNKLTTIKTKEGNDLTLDEEIKAVSFMLTMTDNLNSISNIDLSGGLTNENVSEIKEILSNLDDMKVNMGDASIDIINNTIKDIASSFGEELPIDLTEFDLASVEFANEGNILEQAYNYQNNGVIDVDTLVTSLSNSKLILPLAESLDFNIELNETQKIDVEEAISKLENVSSETIDSIKAMFNLNK